MRGGQRLGKELNGRTPSGRLDAAGRPPGKRRHNSPQGVALEGANKTLLEAHSMRSPKLARRVPSV